MDSPKKNLNWITFRSVEFSPASGEGNINISENAGCWRVNVCDNGPEIPEVLRSEVFSKSGQIAPADGKSRIGTSLGIAISRRIVEEHGGTIDFVSELGLGSDFFFELPSKGRREPNSDYSNDEILAIASNAQKADTDA